MTTLPFELTQQDAVYALAAASDALFAARGSGLYRSMDGGKTWQSVLPSPGHAASPAVTAVAMQGQVVFAGSSGSILRSDDSGASWQQAELTLPLPTVVAIAVSPDYTRDTTVVAATSQDGVFVSTDGGTSWIPWNYGLVDLNVNALALSPNFGSDRTIFVGTESGLFRSHNGGRAWREVDFPMEAAPVISVALSPHAPANRRVFAGTEHSGLWRSDDFGTHWTQVSGDFMSAAVHAIQPHEADLWLLLEDRLIRSSDGGTSWQQDQRQMPPDKMSMALLPGTPSGAVTVGFADGDILPLHPVS